MKIFVNEIEKKVENNLSAFQLRDNINKKCDVVVLNGFPIKEDILLKEEDRLTLIEKGKKPSLEDLESLMIARHTPRVYEKLKRGKVAILGLGGLGSNIAISLSRIGVGKLVLVDYDVIEPSNLNRQQYYIEDIGKFKTEGMKEHIEKINPFIQIKTYNTYITKENMNLLDEVDIIIEAFDDPACKAEISNYVLLRMRDKYLIASSGMAGYYDSNIIETKKIREKFYICGDFTNEAKDGEGLMAPRVAICANHMANLASQILIEHI
ncbi:MAG: thiamine biosynthesis protein ThiF [Terrisporobacter sp.]